VRWELGGGVREKWSEKWRGEDGVGDECCVWELGMLGRVFWDTVLNWY